MPSSQMRDRVIKIGAGLYFLLNAFLVLLYWNWPFGTPETRNFWPLYGMIFCIAAFLIALWRRRPGGYALIAGGVLLGMILLANPRDVTAVARFISTFFFALPPTLLGAYFIRHREHKK